MAQALKPDFYRSFTSLPSIEREQEEIKPDRETQDWNLIYVSDQWKVLRDFIEQMKTELDQMVIQAMSEGASFEEIGQKTAIKEMTKMALDRILDKGKDAHDAIERSRT